ncbi:MAG: hypothetical protein WBK54_00815 [Bacilli bacterium]|jgi:hypothetical protein|nr:hypothetical protein [Acholeplasmataceae bacterium]
MKRFVLIILVSLCFPVAVSGKTIVTTENLLGDWVLEEDGLLLTDHDVLWDEEGEYRADYYDPKIRTEIRRQIIVSNREDLKNGISRLYEETGADVPGFTATGFMPLPDGCFFLYGEIHTGHMPYKTQDRHVFAYLACFKNGFKLWDMIVDHDHYGSFSDACRTENGIALIGQRDNPDQGKNVIVYEFDSEGRIIYEKEFFGSGDDHGLRIFYEKGAFHIIGVTMSDDGPFRGSGSRDIFVGHLNRDKSATLHVLSSPDRDELWDGIYSGGEFYMLAEFDAGGERRQQLLYLDQKKNLRTFDLGAFGRNSDFKISERSGEIVLAFRKGSEEVRALVFGKDLRLLKEKKFRFSEIRAYGLLSGYDCFLAFVLGQSGNERLLITDLESFLLEEKISGLKEVVGIFQEEDGKILFCLAREDFLVCRFQNFRLLENLRETENTIILETEMRYNGKALAKAREGDGIPENAFGKHLVLHRFTSEDFVFYLADEHYYRARINVRNGEVYDIGVRLFFNGEGYLNNKKIEPGTSVEEPGHYLLEIRSGEERYALVFEVSELSETESGSVAWEEISAGALKMKPAERNSGTSELALQEDQPKNNQLFPALLIGSLTGAALGLVIPKIRRGKNA